MKISFYLPTFTWVLSLLILTPVVADDSRLAAAQPMDRQLRQLVADEVLVGAQVAIIRGSGEQVLYHYGAVRKGPGGEAAPPVDDQTLFLIGSCSKPFAAACILSLIGGDPYEGGQETSLKSLNDPISRWLPAYASPRVVGRDDAVRSPTVDELLSHRAGIYSQQVGMTREQAVWIRRFTHTLADAVDGIAESELIAEPGKRYAYSGAGYCVAGRVAELVAEQPLETILQHRICRPLGLRRTTYFPAGRFPDESIATGVMRDEAPHRRGTRHRFPLVGGSLYSTASEMATLGRAIAVQGKGKGASEAAKRLPIAPELLKEFTRIRSPESGYSIGWKVIAVDQDNHQSKRLSHSGSLQSYRARLVVDLESGAVVAACWTLGQRKSPALGPLLDRALNAVASPSNALHRPANRRGNQ